MRIITSFFTSTNFVGATNVDQTRMPAIYVSKYNRFVDNILGRVNKILRKSYDPVRVRLQANSKSKSNKKKNGNKRRKNKPKKSSGRELHEEKEFVLISTTSMANDVINSTTPSPITVITFTPISSTENITEKSVKTQNGNRSNNNNNKRRKSTKGKRNKTKTGELKARATLFGLSSLKRDGDVTVNIMADHTTVRTNFLLGPLTLRVEKDFGRGAKKEIKSATATTEEMHGRLNLRILHGGAATLHSIRVLQPKQVRVDSPDDHDRTREFVWKRSSHIARVVSEKLASATRSMLRPPPKH